LPCWERYKKLDKKEKKMFFRKCEKKKHTSAKLILVVGALAAVGAFSITRKGRDLMCAAKEKITSLFKKEDCKCDNKSLPESEN
jgi:hypothetical protein